jgi:hypothetical protein
MNHAIRFALAATAMLLAALPLATAAQAGPNASIDLLQQTPLSVFSYGLGQLDQSLQDSFTSAKPEPFTMFTAPLSGKIADIATVIYDDKGGTITLNLVKIDKLPDGATPDDACKQAMAALRLFAGLDPTTGALQGGMNSSLLAAGFNYSGSPVKNPPADYAATLDKSFRLRFNGFGEKPYRCEAPLLGAGYTLDK